jgi:hypothetical protein
MSGSGGNFTAAQQQTIRSYPGLFVVAAGNNNRDIDSNPVFPAGHDFANLITVGATTSVGNVERRAQPGDWGWNGNLANGPLEGSNWGATTVDLFAPGTRILSTFNAITTEVCPSGSHTHNLANCGYAYRSGTSMAAPHVTGVAGLILSKYPHLSPLEIKAAILEGVDKVPALNGYCVTGGRLNAYKALLAAENKYPGAKEVVSGDFSGDGIKNDIAAVYGYGGWTYIKVWFSTGSSFAYQGIWYSTIGYAASSVAGRVVSGNFSAASGNRDDIAVFYDYGNKETRVHVFESTGSNFVSQGLSGWWSGTDYAASSVTGRVVAGNFSAASGNRDDIAVFYDYGNNQTRIHVFESTGNNFVSQGVSGWWNSMGYAASSITGRVVAGNFSAASGNRDDIAAFYDYGNNQTRAHMFESTGINFVLSSMSGWWSSTGYAASQITGRVVSGRFGGGARSDIAAFYNESDRSRAHVWLSSGWHLDYRGNNGW